MDARRSIDLEDRGSKLHLVDCPEAIQRLVRKVAEAFQETLKWPSGDELHLQRVEQGVSDLDFSAFGHAAFEFFPRRQSSVRTPEPMGFARHGPLRAALFRSTRSH